MAEAVRREPSGLPAPREPAGEQPGPGGLEDRVDPPVEAPRDVDALPPLNGGQPFPYHHLGVVPDEAREHGVLLEQTRHSVELRVVNPDRARRRARPRSGASDRAPRRGAITYALLGP